MSRFEQLCVVRSLEGVYLRVLADRGQLNAGASIFRLRIESDPPRELTFSADGAGTIASALREGMGIARPEVKPFAATLAELEARGLTLSDTAPCIGCGKKLAEHVNADGTGPGGHCPR